MRACDRRAEVPTEVISFNSRRLGDVTTVWIQTGGCHADVLVNVHHTFVGAALMQLTRHKLLNSQNATVFATHTKRRPA